jgi:hypothetical protein
MENHKDLSNEQEEYLTTGEECGLTVKNTNGENMHEIFEGSIEAFIKFEDLDLHCPFQDIDYPEREEE